MLLLSNHLLEVEELIRSDGSESALAGKLYELGLDYATGHGVEPDLIEAHKWLNLASVRGYTAAAIDRDDVALELSSGEIGCALRLAREWEATH